MPKGFRKRQREHLKSLRLPDELTELPRQEWPDVPDVDNRSNVWISERYMVQVFFEKNDIIRISVVVPDRETGPCPIR